MNRLLLLGGLALGSALVGLLTFNGNMVALVLPLLTFLGASLLFGPDKPQLSAVRTLSTDRATERTRVTVTVELRNDGEGLELVQLTDLRPAGLTIVDGQAATLISLAAGATHTLTYTFTAPRGRYVFGSVAAEASDLLRLFRQRQIIPIPGRHELFVLPNIPRADHIPIRPRQTKAFAGHIQARLGGSGTEFFGVRGYQQGDSLRHINWRANARHPDRFFTNEFELERIADVGIILDARRRSYAYGSNMTLFDRAVEAAAALADTFLSDANRVALLRYGDFLDWTYPGYGKVQRERIMQSLARAQPGDSLVFDELDNLPTRFFPPKSQIILVSPLLPGDASPLIRLRSRGYSLLVVSPDGIAFEESLLGPSQLTKTAARLAQLERALQIRKLRQTGIQLFNWNVDLPFEDALAPALARLRPGAQRNIAIIS